MYDHHNLHFSAWSLDRKGSMVFPSTKSLIINHQHDLLPASPAHMSLETACSITSNK